MQGYVLDRAGRRLGIGAAFLLASMLAGCQGIAPDPRPISSGHVSEKAPATPAQSAIPEPVQGHMEDWMFGCDICQEVCPWNRKVENTTHAALRPRAENVRPALDGLVGMTDSEFRARFPGSAVRRTDAKRMGAVAELILETEQAGTTNK